MESGFPRLYSRYKGLPIKDRKALEMMEELLKRVDSHYQVALPWRHNPP